MPVVSMSKREFTRLEVLLQVQSGRLRVADACALIGLRRRQVFRLLRGLQQDGAASLLSKRRGKPSNHRLPAEVRTLALSIVRERYSDFGPTLAAEKLAAHHGCSVSRETLRGWMIADGLWCDRQHRLASPHQPRRRRDCLGELVQIDGSEHAWFEDRGPVCSLLAFIDDATSRIMALRFAASESAFDYFRATRNYLEAFARHRQILRCLFEVSNSNAEMARMHNEFRGRFIERIRRHLERNISLGLCHRMDTRIASYALGLMIEGVGYSWLVSRFEPWPGGFELEPVVQQLTDLWCRAAYKDGVADLVSSRQT